MPAPPTLVFIPGSWHKPTCYDPIIKILQDQHHIPCTAIALPSNSGNPAATFKDDIDVARAAISNETRNGRDVVVVAHSYGGMVGNSAIKGFAKQHQQGRGTDTDADTNADADANTVGIATGSQPQPQPPTPPPTVIPPPTQKTGAVIGLILIASGFALAGVAFMDPFLGRPPPGWRVNKETGYAELVTPPRELFYHDLAPDEAAFHISQLTTHSLKALFEGGEHAYPGWRDVPVWYIGTIEDRGLPVLAQRMAVGMAREMGGEVEHRELRTSHSPFLSQPGATVRIVVEAVEAFMGEGLGDEVKNGKRETCCGEMVPEVPGAMLWRPFTWFRFGLPLAFGHVVGRGILVFSWARRMWRSRFGLRTI